MTNRIKRVNVIWLLTTYPFVMAVTELDYDIVAKTIVL